jgi:hypothetical protein
MTAVMGRPTKFDAERSDVILDAIRVGSPLGTACKFAGIHRDTLRQWRLSGERASLVRPGKRTPTEQKFAHFSDLLDRALAQAAVQAQRTIHTLMTQDLDGATPEQQRIAMSAAQFYLTHRLSEHYNTRTSTEMTGKNGGPLEVALSAEKAWEIVQAIQSGKPIEIPEGHNET